MSKLRIFFIFSLVILGVLLVFTVFRPMASQEKFSEVSRESVIQGDGQWIIEFAIINKEGEDTNYIINCSTGGETYSETVLIKDRQKFTYIRHFYPATVSEDKAHITIYKKGEATPFEQAIYYLK